VPTAVPTPFGVAGVLGCGARPVHQAAKRAGAAIGSGGSQEDGCRTATPCLPTMAMRLIRSIGDCSMAMPSRVGCAGSTIASSVDSALGAAGCAGCGVLCTADPADATGPPAGPTMHRDPKRSFHNNVSVRTQISPQVKCRNAVRGSAALVAGAPRGQGPARARPGQPVPPRGCQHPRGRMAGATMSKARAALSHRGFPQRSGGHRLGAQAGGGYWSLYGVVAPRVGAAPALMPSGGSVARSSPRLAQAAAERCRGQPKFADGERPTPFNRSTLLLGGLVRPSGVPGTPRLGGNVQRPAKGWEG
jgi:hypothetical protein